MALCRTVNPEEKRRIIGDTFVKIADRTANELNLTWDNLLLGQGEVLQSSPLSRYVDHLTIHRHSAA